MKRFVLAPLFLGALLASCAVQPKISVETAGTTLSARQILRVTNETGKAVRDIRGYLGLKKPVPQIAIVFVPDAPSGYSPAGKFSVVEDFARAQWAPVYFDTTLFLDANEALPVKHERFFTVGLAMMFQELYGQDKEFPFFDLDLAASMKEYASEFLPLSAAMTDSAVFDAMNTRERAVACTEAGSFLIFIHKRYGEAKVRALYRSDGPDWKGVLGKDAGQLDEEWRAYYGLPAR